MKFAVLAYFLLAATGSAIVQMHDRPVAAGLVQTSTDGLFAMSGTGACKTHMSKQDCAAVIAQQITTGARGCFAESLQNKDSYNNCVEGFCGKECGKGQVSCQDLCTSHAYPLFERLAKAQPKMQRAEAKNDETVHMTKEQLKLQLKDAQNEQADAMKDLQEAQQKMGNLNDRIKAKAEKEIKSGNKAAGEAKIAKVAELDKVAEQINGHLANVQAFRTVANRELHQSGMGLAQKSAKPGSFLQIN